ncbi:hypothetical protein AAVH_41486, partial [Aphelenchoides avenae]
MLTTTATSANFLNIYLPTCKLLKLVPLAVLTLFSIGTFVLNEQKMHASLPEPSLGVLNDVVIRLPRESEFKCSEVQSHIRAIPTPRNMSIYL